MHPSLAEQIVSAIRQVAGPGPVALHEPQFNGNELLYLKECIDSTFVSSVGKFVDRFEIELRNFTGSKHAVAVVNGTSALHIALKLAGVKAGDEVLVPALSFVATANAVTYCGAIPHFIDSEISTLGVDPAKLHDYLTHLSEQRQGQCVNRLTGRIIRSVVPMHTFGHPVDMDALMDVTRRFNLVLVEDAAEALGSYYQGKHAGTFGLLGILSFNGNKIMTTGGGGAILTNDDVLARRAKHLTTTAKLPHPWEYRHDAIGYNYRMPNINAALGCAQLEKVPEMLILKRKLFELYRSAFKMVPHIELFQTPERCQSNYWLQSLLLEKGSIHQLDSILKSTNDIGYMTRPAWCLLHELPPYTNCPRMDLTEAVSIVRRLINIPSSSHLALNTP